jgi:hypothetical protein
MVSIFKYDVHRYLECSEYHGNFPSKLKLARVIPLYKSGDIADMNNYRPISVLPSLSKLFEKNSLCTDLGIFNQIQTDSSESIWFQI